MTLDHDDEIDNDIDDLGNEETSLPNILSRIPSQSLPLPEELILTLLTPLITPHKESRDHHLIITSPRITPTAQLIYNITTNILGLETTIVSADANITPLDLVKGLFSEAEYPPKRRATTPVKRPHTMGENVPRSKRFLSTSVTIAKRALAEVIILENFHLANVEVQAILLEVMRERRLVTDFGAHSTPREFLVICVIPPNARLWEYLMDQFYMAYEYTAITTIFQPIDEPIIHPDEFPRLRAQAEQIQLSTHVRSYISSLLVAMRLHPKVVPTSISCRAVRDARNLVQVLSLREGRNEKWTNAECVPEAVELCTSFRLQIDDGEEDVTYQWILKDVIENVRAPF